MECFLQKISVAPRLFGTLVYARGADMICWLRSEHKMLRGCAPDQVHNMLAHDNRWSQLLFWSGVFPYIGKFYIFQEIRCNQNCSIRFIIFGTSSWPEFFKIFDRNSGRNRANFASFDAHFLLSLRSKYLTNGMYLTLYRVFCWKQICNATKKKETMNVEIRKLIKCQNLGLHFVVWQEK